MKSFKTDQDLVDSVLMNLKERVSFLRRSGGRRRVIRRKFSIAVWNMISQSRSSLTSIPISRSRDPGAGKNVAEYFMASATLRIYDPSKRLISCGSISRRRVARSHSFEDTVAGKWSRERQATSFPAFSKVQDGKIRSGLLLDDGHSISIRVSLKIADTEVSDLRGRTRFPRWMPGSGDVLEAGEPRCAGNDLDLRSST
jgi:hypothetical protein